MGILNGSHVCEYFTWWCLQIWGERIRFTVHCHFISSLPVQSNLFYPSWVPFECNQIQILFRSLEIKEEEKETVSLNWRKIINFISILSWRIPIVRALFGVLPIVLADWHRNILCVHFNSKMGWSSILFLTSAGDEWEINVVPPNTVISAISHHRMANHQLWPVDGATVTSSWRGTISAVHAPGRSISPPGEICANAWWFNISYIYIHIYISMPDGH